MPTIVNQRLDNLLETIFDGESGPIHVIGPSKAVIDEIVEVGTELEEPPKINLLAAESTLKDVVDDFLVASHAADLIEADVLSLRTLDSPPGNDIAVSDSEVTALIEVGGTAASLSTEDAEFLADAKEFYTDAWSTAEPFSLRTPPLSRVRQTLGTEIGSEVETDFDAVLDSLETARGDGDGLDEVTISLLVAAKNEELLYDISKWGEDVGIASKATFSRTKTELEDLGLIDTEKVPIDVGRPRLRLLFGHEKLRDSSADELASVAQSLMAA